MNRLEIVMLANELMTTNKANRNIKAEGWKFEFNNRANAIGLCRYSNKTIYISTVFADALTNTEVKDTLLHEIAHAMTPGEGHGVEWKRMARILGCAAKSTARLENAEQIQKKYAICIRRADGTLEKVSSCSRKKDLSCSFIPGRRAETLGKLFIVESSLYESEKRKEIRRNEIQGSKINQKAAALTPEDVPTAPRVSVKPRNAVEAMFLQVAGAALQKLGPCTSAEIKKSLRMQEIANLELKPYRDSMSREDFLYFLDAGVEQALRRYFKRVDDKFTA